MVRKVSGVKRRKKAVSGTKKTTRRRRRRVSGTGDLMGMAEMAGGIILGNVAAREGATMLTAAVPSITAIPSAIGQIALGLFLPKFVKGSFVQALCYGIIANGGVQLLVNANIVSGPRGMLNKNRMAYRVNGGTPNLKVIQGTNKLNVIGRASVNGPTTRISNQPTNVPRIRLAQHYV
jgi:hypothetical protein